MDYKISQAALLKINTNVNEIAKTDKVEIGKLVNGLTVTRSGQIVTEEELKQKKATRNPFKWIAELFTSVENNKIHSENAVLQLLVNAPNMQDPSLKEIADLFKNALKALLERGHPEKKPEEMTRMTPPTLEETPKTGSSTVTVEELPITESSTVEVQKEELQEAPVKVKKEEQKTIDPEKLLIKQQVIRKALRPDWSQESQSKALSRKEFHESYELPQLLATFKELGMDGKEQSQAGKALLLKQWMSLEVGHEWGINLDYSIGSTALTTEGNYRDATAEKGAILTTRYLNGLEGGWIPDSVKDKVQNAVHTGAEAAAHAFMKSDKIGDELMEALNKNGVVTVPAGWTGHAVGFTVHKAADGKYFLYYCNRGQEAFEQAEDRAILDKEGSYMVCWEIGDPSQLTPQMLTAMATSGLDGNKDEVCKKFIEGREGIHRMLGLKNPVTISKQGQKVGNCSWANFKGAIHASAIAAYYDEAYKNSSPDQFDSMQTLTENAIPAGATLFKEIEHFGRNRSLSALTDFNAHQEAGLSPHDHLRALALIARKVAKKPAPQYREMEAQLLEGLKSCPYSIQEFKSVGAITLSDLVKDLKGAGAGAFAIQGDNLFYFNGKKIERHKLTPEDQKKTMGELLSGMSSMIPGFIPRVPVIVEANPSLTA